MGYRVVDPEAVDPPADRPCEYRSLSDPGGLTEMAVNLFRADPGEQVPLVYHHHETQQEAFFVTAGTLHVETPEETFTVHEGQLFVADPESPHRAHNPDDADESVELLAIGAPPAPDDGVPYDPDDE
jgi:mannose-6-phosphate isomerase-like protein (cupin superfamily)